MKGFNVVMIFRVQPQDAAYPEKLKQRMNRWKEKFLSFNANKATTEIESGLDAARLARILSR